MKKQKQDKKRASRATYMREYRAKNKAGKRVAVSISQAEYYELARQAKAHGMRPTSFIKSAYLAYLRQEYLVPKDTEDALLLLSLK